MRSYHWRPGKDQLLNLTFYGKDLDLGAQKTDYKIKGLGIPCTAIYLHSRHLVCTIDTGYLGKQVKYNVTVEVGNLVFVVGVVSLVRKEEAEEAAAPDDQMKRLALIIGLALFSALLLMVFLVILVHYAVKRWRHRRKRADKNHLVNGASHVTTSSVSTLTSVTRYKSENGIRTVALPENRLLQLPLEQSMKIELTLWCIRPEDVTFLRVLREGLTGRLSSAILRCSESKSRQVMVKSLKGSEMTVDCISVFLQDSTRLKDVQHPNVLPLCGVTIGLDSVPHAIFPYVLGNLHGFLTTEEGKGLIKSNIQSVCRQIASGMAFIASVGIVHSDLATRNIWVSRNHEIQVGDAALSRDFFREDYWPVTPYSRPVPVRWMAPENFIHEKFTMKSDVWSFGVVLWEIHTYGSQPYIDVSNPNVGPMVRDGKTLTRPPGCADILYSIMSSCWRAQPLDRPDFKEILRQLQPPEASPTMATRL